MNELIVSNDVAKRTFREALHRPTAVPAGAGSGRVVLAFDATGSMQPYWDRVRREIGRVLDGLAASGARVAIRVVAYRDVSDGAAVVEKSEWSASTDTLRRFVEGVQCDGGGDTPESVEYGLRAALAEPELTGVVLIGDAPPHRQATGPWDGEVEARELKSRGAPIYAVAVGGIDQTVAAFTRLAELSGGRCVRMGEEGLGATVEIIIGLMLGGAVAERYVGRAVAIGLLPAPSAKETK